MNHSSSERNSLRLISPLHRANRQLAIFLEDRFAGLGVTAPEAHLVTYVHAYGPCPIRELVRVFGYKAPTMTSMLDRLERKSLIRRDRHPGDRRSVVVTVAKEGAALAARARSEVEELDRTIRRRVTAEDVRGFENVLAAIAEITGVDVRREDRSREPRHGRQ